MNRTAFALPLMLLPGWASADITSDDVWNNVTAAYSAMGLTVTGTPVRSGNTLTISDGMVTLTYPIIGGQATATIPQMGLIEQDDGTVRILTPDAYLVQVAADIPEEAEQVSFEIAIAQSGLDSVASGTPGDVTYTTDIADFDAIMNALKVNGEDLNFTLEMDSDGYAGVTQMTDGDVFTIASDLINRATVTRFSMDIEGVSQASTTSGGTVNTKATLVLPPDMNIMNLAPALRAGLSLNAAMQSDASSSETTTTMNGDLISEQIQNTGPGAATFKIDQAGVNLTADISTFDATITQMDLLPFPIALSGGRAGGSFAFPLLASDAPQPFQYAITMSELEIADGLWSMVDPTSGLDRSPIDLIVDLSGTLQWDLDLPDVMALAALEQSGEMPVQILSADINAFALNALGGAVSASGGFIFDNMDMTTFDGLPRPEGSAKLQATGLNAVIDQLVGIGLLPEDQAGMGRMFMGMFARATGDDGLESEVEVNAEGHVLLNGQRMR